MVSISEICAYLKNYFVPSAKSENRSYIHIGTFEISDGKIKDTDFLKENQYFRIIGSDLNDGIYCNCPESLKKLKNETFTGAIHEMSIPPDFLKLYEEIQVWSEKNESADSINMSPFVAESFGGYSYSKTNSRVNQISAGNAVTWQEQYEKKLSIWRKI